MGMNKQLFISLCASVYSLKSLTNRVRLPPHRIAQAISLNVAHSLRFQHSSSVKVLERCRVSPPPGFIPDQPTLPSTFFDLPWLLYPRPLENLLFYSYNHNKTHFMNTTLPNIKHSLSLTLQHFYPLAGTFTWYRRSSIKPHIHCSENNLGVMLTVAESSLDFNHLVSNEPRDINMFSPLVPELASATSVNEQVEGAVMALQVTLFPDTGISIGIAFLHVVQDGMTFYQFMKSWAAVCKSGLGDTSCLPPESLPFLDRSVINDPNNLEKIYLNELEKFDVSKNFHGPSSLENRVRATFSMDQTEIQKIKRLVQDQLFDKHKKDVAVGTLPSLRLSTLVLTCSYVWVCLIKVLESEVVDEKERVFISLPVECRELLNPPLPPTYFGNCLMNCFVDLNKNDLMGEHGTAIAAEAVGNAIQRMKEEGVLKGAENMFTKFKMVMEKEPIYSVSGSPKLGVYDIDFGLGRPKKSEVISIFVTGVIYVKECKDGNGGVEVGLVLDKPDMDAFTSLFKNTLRVLP